MLHLTFHNIHWNKSLIFSLKRRLAYLKRPISPLEEVLDVETWTANGKKTPDAKWPYWVCSDRKLPFQNIPLYELLKGNRPDL